MDEVFLENVPALWSMKSIDELLQYLWVTEWGMPSEQYSRSQAETIFADLFVSDFTQQQENYGYGLNPPHPSFFRDLPSDVTLDADTYLRYMWQDVWRNNQPFNYSQAETQFILSYGVSLDDLSFIEEVNSQNITPELQALLDSPFASVFYATSNTSNGQQTLAELIEEYGMDAFIAYYNDFAQLSSNAGVLQNSELTDYVQSYLYLQALENGDELPFTPEFNPDAATDNMLFAEGVLLSYGEEGVQDDGIGRWMIERTAIMLSMLPEFEGANTEDIENELYALLPENFTGEDAANLANDIAFQLSTTIQAMSAADPDLEASYSHFQSYAQNLIHDSGIYLFNRQLDEARQIVNEWNRDEATELLNEFRGKIGAINALPEMILGVSTGSVKQAFGGILTPLENWYNQMETFRQQIPMLEDQHIDARAIMEGQLDEADNLLWLSLGLTIGVLFDPVDVVISFFEYLDTGDPSVLLFAAIPLVPGAAARTMRIVRSLPDIATEGLEIVGRFGDDVFTSGGRFLDDLDYTSVTLNGLPPDFFKKLFGELGQSLDNLISKLTRRRRMPTVDPNAVFDTPVERAQAIRYGQHQNDGGAISTSGLQPFQQGVDFHYTPLQGSRTYVSMKEYGTTLTDVNPLTILQETRRNMREVTGAGFAGNTELFVTLNYANGDEVLSIIENGPLTQMAQEGVYTRMIFEGNDGSITIILPDGTIDGPNYPGGR